MWGPTVWTHGCPGPQTSSLVPGVWDPHLSPLCSANHGDAAPVWFSASCGGVFLFLLLILIGLLLSVPVLEGHSKSDWNTVTIVPTGQSFVLATS